MRFIEEMTASAMHELKNKLAIINENSGLVQDLTFIAKQKGNPLDIDRIDAISNKISQQVYRSDDIIKKVNRFCQSLDLPEQETDLEKTVVFVTALADRLIEKEECQVKLISPDTPVTVNTHPFFLKNLLWKVLDFLCISKGSSSLITITFNAEEKKKAVIFSSGTDAGSLIQENDILTDSRDIHDLAQYLGAELTYLGESKDIGLIWSENTKNHIQRR